MKMKYWVISVLWCTACLMDLSGNQVYAQHRRVRRTTNYVTNTDSTEHAAQGVHAAGTLGSNIVASDAKSAPATFVSNNYNEIDILRSPSKKSEERYYMIQKVTKSFQLNDEEGVQGLNTISIPVLDDDSLITLTAKTIKPDHTEVVIEADKIKTQIDENGQKNMLIAFEGLNVGDEVTYSYVKKRPVSYFGTAVMQFPIKTASATFILRTPYELSFETKSYNGFPAVKDSVDLQDSSRVYYAVAENIPAIKDGEYTDLTPNLQRVEYRFSHWGNEAVKQYTWSDFVRTRYPVFYSLIPNETKAFKKYFAAIKPDGNLTEEQQIIAIENTVKKDIAIDGDAGADYELIQNIVDKKKATPMGIVRLLIACYKELGIKVELALSSDRFDYPLDEHFENWNHLSEYVFYFPKEEQYMSPAMPTLRYPFIYAGVRENKALFFKEVTLGGETSALASIRTIPAAELKEDAMDLKASVRFDESFTPLVADTLLFRGYLAVGFREIITNLPADKEKDFMASQFSDLIEKASDIKQYAIENKGYEHYTDNAPVILSAAFPSEGLLESAGAHKIFKIGVILGRQAAMYKDEKRVLPISIHYPHSLSRDIEIVLPDGYQVNNVSALNRHIAMKDGSAGFIAQARVEGNRLKLHIYEFYNQSTWPAADYDDFRKVINAAADFNKATVLFTAK